MSKFKALFNRIGNAKPIGGDYADRLAPGKHRIILTRFGVKESKQEMGNIIEVDFYVDESTAHKQGETKGWAWFPDSKGWAGKYEEDRCNRFLRAIGDCTEDDRDTTEIGADLSDDEQPGRGLVLEAEVTFQTDRAGNPKTNKDGQPFTNVSWIPVPQSLEDVAATRAELDKMTPPPEKEPEKTAAGRTGGRGGVLANLRGRT